MKFAQFDDKGLVIGVFMCPQPDALDHVGTVICKGVPTVPVDENDPRVVVFETARAEKDKMDGIDRKTFIQTAQTVDDLKTVLLQWIG